MKLFTDLYMQLDATTRTSEKTEALTAYFRAAPPLDAAWAVFVLSGRKIGKAVSSRLLREWAAEASGYPGWLFDQCHRVVGDLSETLSLLVPPAAAESPPPLHEVVEHRVRALAHMTKADQKKSILSTWALLSAEQRMLFHKLLTGNFRVGVSKQLLIRSLAEVANVEAAVIAHRLAGHWMPDASTMSHILGEHDSASNPAVPYPFMLAHPLQEELPTLGVIEDWMVEWKWDGIRAQLLRRAGHTALWSRGDEAVAPAFPEIIQAAATLPEGTVFDGEIVAWDETSARPMSFNRLQRRLNRKSVELTFWPEVPVAYIAFDILESDGQDIRKESLATRRSLLEAKLAASHPALRISSPLTFAQWADITHAMLESRERSVEGVMLKRRDSVYLPGRPTGLWWKLKVAPYTVDAVMIAAEPGRGRRAGLLTDYTFGVWSEGMLVPIAKAYSGLTDEEITDVDRFARRHTTARHGPVHTIEPLRVFELGFEGIQSSTRHRSGIALRFPRILRIRTDKRPADADRIETMRALLDKVEAMR